MKIWKTVLALIVGAFLVAPAVSQAQSYQTNYVINTVERSIDIDSLADIGVSADRGSSPSCKPFTILPGTRFSVWIGVDDFGAWDVGSGDGTDSLIFILQREDGKEGETALANRGTAYEDEWRDIATVATTTAADDSTDFPIFASYNSVSTDTNFGGRHRILVAAQNGDDSTTADGIGLNILVRGTGVVDR